MSIVREQGTPITKNYEVSINNSFDSRLTVDSVEALNYSANWFKEVKDEFTGDIEIKFIGFKGMPVSDKSTGSLYVLKDYNIGDTIDNSNVEFELVPSGNSSIDTSNLVTIDGEQIISGNKTFTGEIDFSDATVKGLAIDPTDVDLAGYATEDWVKSQGYVTASYLDNILTFSTSGNEASAVNYSSDEALFTEDLYVTNPVGNFVTGENVNGLSLKEIITRLLKLEANV